MGRVILDKKTFLEENYGDRIHLSPQELNDASQLMLCPPYTHGFSLILKQWYRFSVDSLSETNWDKSALDSVIIDEHRKDVLKALVLAHEFPSGAVDLFTQKGKGLVVLLYGSPGTGKTMTAGKQRGLIGLATNYLKYGTNADRITGRGGRKAPDKGNYGRTEPAQSAILFRVVLQWLLKLATTWQAVVLLDEADIFLDGRSNDRGKASDHNALVAVLLKHLEYFGGIIFLTSNLVRVFDTAMKSRIHIALEYHPPDLDMMRRIWSSAVPAVPETERELDTDEDLDKFLANRLNGREIANAVYTSRTLARYEKTKLRSEHIIKVLEAKRMFEKSFRQIQAKGRGGGAAQVSRSNTFEMAETE